MKLLLTSAGIKNPSIKGALVEMLEKPISESDALCIPTATYAMRGGAARAWEFISGKASTPMCELGWKSLGVLELTALPGIPEEHWLPMVQEADVLLVNGGDALYLAHWMRQSGLADMLPSLQAVYVGLSGGSMVMAPQVGEEFMGYGWDPPDGLDKGLGLVDFSIFPHLDHEDLPENNMANAEIWAAGIHVPGYVIDDQTAIKIVGGELEVISEGNWKRLTPLGR
jgi:dipeptidase E